MEGHYYEGEELYGMTPLLLAAANGQDIVVRLRLEKGADIQAKDREYDRTPLSWARANGHEAVIQLLPEEGESRLRRERRLAEVC